MTSFSLKGILLQYGGFLVAMLAVAITVVSPRSEALFGISTTTCLLIGIAVAFVSLPLHEMRPYQDKRSMTTEKAAAEQHMKDLAEQEKQFKEGKKKK
mmetsp:Transcript_3819/g.11758  ORF Transcript_3819/g.11758 Transcript_3819/m.11758 type:complete len:98 (-) Transcript_3819:926-1219(-)